MAHVKSGGAARQHAQRPGKRLGVKVYGGQSIKTGEVIVRQRGTQFHAGENPQLGRDFTLYATATGTVNFKKNRGVSQVAVTAK